MKKYLIIILLISLTQVSYSQTIDHHSLKLGVNADYLRSGSTNTLLIGPALFLGREKSSESEFWHVITMDAGISWSKDTRVKPVTSEGYFFGSIPGLVFGISSQQYYNMETKYGDLRTDVRLSGEVIFAFFGFIGYRYQQPLIKNNVAKDITRHALIIKIPIPIKTIPGK
jgi:hypothetical protein